MLNELKTKAKNFYEVYQNEIWIGLIIGGMTIVGYDYGLWKGRAEGLNVGSRALAKMVEQISKVESK